MTKVLFMITCDDKTKNLLNSLSEQAEIIYADKDTPEDELIKLIEDAEIIVGEPKISALKNAKNLKLVQLPIAGTDEYTLAEEFPEGVTLTNSSGAFGRVISQYVLGATLSICNRFNLYRDNQRKHLWRDEGSETTLFGKRVLIVGAGNIGQNVAERFSNFYTVNVGIRRNVSDIPQFFDEMHSLDELDEQLPLADVVVACIPNSDYTHHLFNERRFMLMKKDAIFVNVGRGALVAQDDLVKVLKSGHLLGAAIDVAEPEPLPSDNPIWDIDNLVITPHVSGNTFGHSKEITNGMYAIAYENIKNYIEGKPLKNVIDFKKFRK